MPYCVLYFSLVCTQLSLICQCITRDVDICYSCVFYSIKYCYRLTRDYKCVYSPFLMALLFLEAWPAELTYGDNQVLVMGTWIFMFTTCMALLLGAISMFEEDHPEPRKRNK